MAFTPRTSKYSPTDMVYYDSVNENNKYWYTSEYSTNSPNICLPNCTTYAMGRSGEIAKKSVMGFDMLNQAGYSDAKWWYGNALWKKTQTPTVGAVACWYDPHDSEDTAYWGGHVAIVEETDGTLANTKLSMSGYVRGTGTRSFTNPGTSSSWYFVYETFEQTNFWYTTYKNRQGVFQGFLINPYVDPSPTPPTPTGKWTVTLNVSPSGYGYCTGQGSYDDGTEATLSAIPYSNYEFEKWSDGYPYSPRYWTITSDLTLTAYFKKKSYTISATVDPDGSGSVTGTGTYEYGSSATIEAVPNKGYKFLKWSDGSTDGKRTFTNISENKTLTAYFKKTGILINGSMGIDFQILK